MLSPSGPFTAVRGRPKTVNNWLPGCSLSRPFMPGFTSGRQPRLAMTAAMAFFSIALTMNLTGVHLQDLRASDLKPSSLKRDFTNANASVKRYYEGLRVVYV